MADKVEPIAVVGMGCRFPGDATSPKALWEMIIRGESAWSEFPEDRVNIASYFHPSGNRQGSISFKGAHFLKQNVATFDTSFFSISAAETKAIDPQQRMLLEVAVEALDSAGVDRDDLLDSQTGVWIGSFVKDYEQIVLRDPDNSPVYGATGNGIAIMSNRISYFLDIKGPSMTIDTGCSASLVCVHNACQSLRDGEIDVGLAGGAGLILTPNTMMPMTALNFLSPDGKCFTFDARANGYGRGEGIGIVVLKRLSDAIRANDTIRAVIRGSRVNQDGRTPGITLPSAEAQTQNIRSLYQRAGLETDRTAYVECHGTGTQAGDCREVAAVSASFCKGRDAAAPIYVGSVKTNIGHLEGCAGIAGLIKGIVTVEHGVIPKHINFEEPGNPAIDFKGLKVKVPVDNTPWPVDGLRRASINCFGFGGTNAHLILDDAAHYLAERGLVSHHSTAIFDEIRDPSISHSLKAEIFENFKTRMTTINQLAGGQSVPERNVKSQLFVFSAHEQPTLLRVLGNLAEYLLEHKEKASTYLFEDLAYTFGCRRTKLQWRTSIAAQSIDELIVKLQQYNEVDCKRTSEDRTITMACVFGGQGAQWFAMGRELLGFDIYLESIIAATRYMTDKLKSPFSLLAELLKDEHSTKINQPQISQPATTALQVALVDLLIHFYGVIPSSVVGHSSGEIAAAYAMGAISRETAWELAYHRGFWASTIRPFDGQAYTKGRMLAVGLSDDEAYSYVSRVGIDRLVVACINSPTSVTLSGDIDAILQVQEMLNADRVFNRLLVVDIAYHSHHMKRCAVQYLQSIDHLMPREPARSKALHSITSGKLVASSNIALDESQVSPIPKGDIPVMYSSVTGKQLDWRDLTPEYWMLNMSSTVRFSDAVAEMIQHSDRQKPDIILELGPHASLQSPIQQILDVTPNAKHKPVYLSMLRRNKDATVTTLETVGKLWCHGFIVDMSWVTMRNVQFRRPKLLVDLPNYPWNHSTEYWHESHLSRANRFQVHGRYDLVGRPSTDSMSFQSRWRGFFRVEESPWIVQHQVQKTTIYPAAGMVSMVIEAARQLSDSIIGIELSQFNIEKAMIIPLTEHGLEHVLNLNLIKQDDARALTACRFSFVNGDSAASTSYGFLIASKPLQGEWQEHGSGVVTIHHKTLTEDGMPDRRVSEERVSHARHHHEAYLEAKNTCDEKIVPRQLYETLDVVGMNYGPLFQNITSLNKRDNHCHYVVNIPDTQSVMPSGFEFPHIIHPATLDGIFQTAFSFGGDSMVPSSIGSIYVSFEPGLPTTAGKELVGYAKAESRSFREAHVSFVASDESWKDTDSETMKDPLIVIEDMKFTTLTASPASGEGGFLPYHHNLCSEVVWEDEEADLESNASLDVQPSSPTKQPMTTIPERVFLLVPEVITPDLARLRDRISNNLQCKSLTLDDIGDGTDLPAYGLSLLEALPGHHIIWNWSEKDFLAFRSLVNSTKGILWVTRGAQLESTNPRGGLFVALARTIQSENPQKHLVTLDIAYDAELASDGTVERITNIFSKSFFEPAKVGLRETEYADRAGRLIVPRLVHIQSLNRLIERGSIPPEPVVQVMGKHEGGSLELKIGEVGKPESLHWIKDNMADVPLALQEVNIKVLSAGLNATDSDIILQHGQEKPIGTDVYGIIESVGGHVRDFAPGDLVIGIVRGSFKEHVRCHGALVQKVPHDIADPVLVLLPTSLTVAHYALSTLARLRGSDTILIHAGAGSFGQAAIRVAKHFGAKVITTVTNYDQRQMLKSHYEIPDECIIGGDRVSFVDPVMRLTGSKGVEVVFDPTGECREADQDCIAEAGHVIRFAKCGASGQLVDMTGKTFMYSMLSLECLVKNEPWRLGEALESLRSDDIRKWLMRPHGVVKQYDYSKLPDAVYALAVNRHCSMAYIVPSATIPVPIMPPRNHAVHDYLRPDGTYVLAGQGGLALHIAKMLEANGVKDIALLSRSGASSEASQTAIAFLRKREVNVQVLKVDICDKKSLQCVLETIQRTMPRIRGLFQCAATVCDAVFDNMTYDDWQMAVRPKTLGSCNLYEVFPRNMDFFIFLSSSAGVIGNRGQANYAVGNAFQDAFARHISAQGSMRSVSIDLGPVLGAGMLAEDPRTLDMLRASGFFGIRLQDFEIVINQAITGYTDGDERIPPQVVTGVGTGGLVRQDKTADPYWTRTALFTHLNKVDVPSEADGLLVDADGAGLSVKYQLSQAVGAEQAKEIVATGLCHMLAASVNMQPGDVDDGKPPSSYGVDSLVAVGVRSWIYRECGVDVSVFEILSDTSVSELSAQVVTKGRFAMV